MKVLQINSVYGIGSTGRIVADIHKVLSKKSVESYIAYGRATLVQGSHVLKIGTKLDYYMHGALTRVFDTHALWGSERATVQFLDKVQRIDPDVIHLHNLHGYYINIRLLFDYLRKSRKPVIWTLHDCWAFTGHCAYFSYAKCNKWEQGCQRCPQKKSYPTSHLFDASRYNYSLKRHLFTSLDNLTIVTPSQWLANLVQVSFLAKFPVRVIHNGIDTSVFSPVDPTAMRVKYGLSDQFVILGVAQGWGERKGLKYFHELASMIDAHCTIVLVGLNDQQLTQLPANIIGIKRTSSVQELAQLYSAADVFVNPTLEDNFPTANLEALACGTPVITFDTGGSPESINDEIGVVVKQGDVPGLKDAINKLRQETSNFRGGRCVDFGRVKYGMWQRAQDYLHLYRTCTTMTSVATK